MRIKCVTPTHRVVFSSSFGLGLGDEVVLGGSRVVGMELERIVRSRRALTSSEDPSRCMTRKSFKVGSRRTYIRDARPCSTLVLLMV